mmetsp:Transcript_54202/g.137450  ORF Transcript_54202/g.137450 Transcript_54202/m.137450 type:complete len:227 (-) Transcript_54202:94-774(-)
MSLTSICRRCSSSLSFRSFSKIRSRSASAAMSRLRLSSSLRIRSSSTCFCISCCQALLLLSCCALASSCFCRWPSFSDARSSASCSDSYQGGVLVPSWWSCFPVAAPAAAPAVLDVAPPLPARGRSLPATAGGSAPPATAAAAVPAEAEVLPPPRGPELPSGLRGPFGPMCEKATAFQTRWSASKCTTARRLTWSTLVTTTVWCVFWDSDHHLHFAPTFSQLGGGS